MKTVRHSNRPKVCAARREWHTFFGGLEKKNVVLCVKTCACAPWICQEKKKKIYFGVHGPLLERVPVHAPQYRGHTFILKKACASFEKNRKSVTKAQKASELGLLKCTA